MYENRLIISAMHHSKLTESRDGAVVRALVSHQCGPGSIPGLGVICGLSLLLVLVLAPRGFSPGTPVFPSPQKPTFLNSNSIRKVSPISVMR